ncbi:MAG: hypothetical protein KF744_05525 [Taibaiella sp.]|nr:hypothetical protein [Taibaiella sp.]
MPIVKSLFTVFAVFIALLSVGQSYVPDPGFAFSGTFTETDVNRIGYSSAALQPDGKIVLARQGAVVRLNPDGIPDNSFADHGRYEVDLRFNKVLIQPDGKILACGSINYSGTSHSFITRLLPSGSPDPSFGTAGFSEVDVDTVRDGFASMVLAPDGGIYAACNYALYHTALVKFRADGRPDSSFGNSGIVQDTISVFSDLKMDDVGRLVISGYYRSGAFPSQGIVVRYMPDGNRDTSFGSIGLVMSGSALAWWYSALNITTDGEIICVGPYESGVTKSDYLACRYHVNGVLDTSFGTGGSTVIDFFKHSDAAYNIAIKNDKIFLCGETNNYYFGTSPAASRLNMDGSLDTTFAKGGIMTDTSEYGSYAGVLIQPDGKLLFYGNEGEYIPYDHKFPLIRRFYDPSLSIKDQAKHNPINIFPNPTSGELCITGTDKPRVIISSLASRKLMDVSASTIDISHLPDGMYIISVFDTMNNLLKTEKLVKDAEYEK